MKGLKVNMDMVNCGLLCVVLVLVVMCCVRKNETFKIPERDSDTTKFLGSAIGTLGHRANDNYEHQPRWRHEQNDTANYNSNAVKVSQEKGIWEQNFTGKKELTDRIMSRNLNKRTYPELAKAIFNLKNKMPTSDEPGSHTYNGRFSSGFR
jgi:hypothetical protein